MTPFHIALYQPEIPPNTGNIIRLCANIGCCLHLIKPLAFDLDNKRLRRAGLDYKELANVTIHQDFASFLETMNTCIIYAVSTKGKRHYTDITQQNYQKKEYIYLFGAETRGLPDSFLKKCEAEQIITIPMQANSRSLNLSNSVAIIAYHAWATIGFSPFKQ